MSDETPQKPRSRLILPGSAERPRTRLIAPAVEASQMAETDFGATEDGYGEPAEAPVSVAPLSPPPAASADPEGEPAIGEAEQGEFTVIDEDTGETHTVPVKVSSMAPPPVAVAVADPDVDAVAEAAARAAALAEEEAAAQEAARQQAAYEAELAAYEQQKAAYEAAQQQAAYEAAQQQAYYPPPQPTHLLQGYGAQPHLPHRVPQAAGYAQRPGPNYGQVPIVVGGGVPGWALVMIGLLFGFVMSVLAYKFTDFGKMIRPDVKRPVEQSSVGSGGIGFHRTPLEKA